MLRDRFIKYLEKNCEKSKNTIVAYNNGINKLYNYCSQKYNETNEIKLWPMITVFDVEDFLYTLKEVDTIDYGNIKKQETTTRGYSASSINLFISGIKAFLTYLRTTEFIKTNPGATLVPKKLDQHATINKDIIRLDEIKKMIKATYTRQKGDNLFEFNSTRNRFFIGLLSISGLRQEEAAQLTLNMIKTEVVNNELCTVIYVPRAIVKNKMDKTIVLTNSVNGYYKEYMFEREEMLKGKNYSNNILFISRNNKKLSNKSVNDMLDKYRVIAGVEVGVTAHDFRHRCASTLDQNRVSMNVMKAILGWTNNDITNRYVHVTLEQIKSACSTVEV